MDEAEDLDRFFPGIMGCRIVLDNPHRHSHHGQLFHVTIDLTVPGKELVVRRCPDEHKSHADAYLAIRDAFREIRRQLQDHLRLRRGFTKQHVSPPHAHVRVIFPHQGYGFLETKDGRELYFHKNSVLHNAFNRLKAGDEVKFHETTGDEGPQASTVEGLGRH
ncbi:MAG: HPF/RaiA family ribosome-associated protein [Proteobacteria bacterium]|nr:HPF/RaiA family ribosome-associated protein [Pseudomonadota bacterium]